MISVGVKTMFRCCTVPLYFLHLLNFLQFPNDSASTARCCGSIPERVFEAYDSATYPSVDVDLLGAFRKTQIARLINYDKA